MLKIYTFSISIFTLNSDLVYTCKQSESIDSSNSITSDSRVISNTVQPICNEYFDLTNFSLSPWIVLESQCKILLYIANISYKQPLCKRI